MIPTQIATTAQRPTSATSSSRWIWRTCTHRTCPGCASCTCNPAPQPTLSRTSWHARRGPRLVTGTHRLDRQLDLEKQTAGARPLQPGARLVFPRSAVSCRLSREGSPLSGLGSGRLYREGPGAEAVDGPAPRAGGRAVADAYLVGGAGRYVQGEAGRVAAAAVGEQRLGRIPARAAVGPHGELAAGEGLVVAEGHRQAAAHVVGAAAGGGCDADGEWRRDREGPGAEAVDDPGACAGGRAVADAHLVGGARGHVQGEAAV